MAELKTKKNNASVEAFIATVENEQKRLDSIQLCKIFEEVTGEKPMMWGDSIIGFGEYHYKSERSRQEWDWPLTGFSPRKQHLTIYIMSGFDWYDDLLSKIGKSKHTKSCFYCKRLADIDISLLKIMIADSVKKMKKIYCSL